MPASIAYFSNFALLPFPEENWWPTDYITAQSELELYRVGETLKELKCIQWFGASKSYMDNKNILVNTVVSMTDRVIRICISQQYVCINVYVILFLIPLVFKLAIF